MWLQRIDTKIAAHEEREAEQERGRQNRPAEPDWVVELGIGNGRPPIEVHVGGCYAAGKRRRPVPRDEARRLLTSGVRACGHCQPDTALEILDLSADPAPSTTPSRPSRPSRPSPPCTTSPSPSETPGQALLRPAREGPCATPSIRGRVFRRWVSPTE
ncbi:DUF6233 domain-containing protein [Streptomyces sp. NPDC002685]|uniref:DUF6233 domain-containing protein n=1 Tax=Streptomyces sp. NPDC002685 TaxID=3154540 RepID=UPI00332F10F9